MTKPTHDITVDLTGEDGNAFVLIGRVRREMRRAGVAKDEIDAFSREAMSGDYDHVLQTIMATVNVDFMGEELT